MGSKTAHSSNPLEVQDHQSDCVDSTDMGSSTDLLNGAEVVQRHTKKAGCCEKILNVVRNITVEPILFMDILSWSIQSSLTTNLLLEKVCSEHEYPQEICANLSLHSDIQVEVQKEVTRINMYKDLITVFPNIFFVLFIGAWSDKYGRKIPLTLPIIGSFAATLIYLANAYWMSLPAMYILFAAVPQVFTGGFITMLMAAYAYMTDITKVRSRTTRIALMDFSFVIGFPMGIWVSNWIYYELGYFGIYGISATIFLVAILYSLIRIEDTRGPFSHLHLENAEFAQRPSSMIKDLFDTQNVKDVMRVCLKLRPNQGRGKILGLMLSMFSTLFTYGVTNISYLFVKRKFGWDYNQYVHLGIVKSLTSSVGISIVLPLLSYKLQMHDSILGLLGSASAMASALMIGFAPDSWYMYLGTCIGCLGGLVPLINRAMLSKIVPDEEIGKVFSMTAGFEAAVPLMSSPLYTLVYDTTIASLPGAAYLMTSLFYLGPTVIFLWLFFTRHLRIIEYHIHEDEIPNLLE